MAIRWAYSTNGQRIYQVDMCPSSHTSRISHTSHASHPAEGEITRYPTPAELWQMTFAEARAWLESVQHEDGGWGERCNTYDDPVFKGQGPSTASQTAWAVMGLCTFGDPA